MSRVCSVCGKGPMMGNTVSHSNNRHRRRFSPNLQKIRVITKTGAVTREYVCTRCIRSGCVHKVPVRVVTPAE